MDVVVILKIFDDNERVYRIESKDINIEKDGDSLVFGLELNKYSNGIKGVKVYI